MADWLSVSSYARAYSVARHTVYKWLEAGLLEAFQVGAVVRIKNCPPRVQGCSSRQVTPPAEPPGAVMMDAHTCGKH